MPTANTILIQAAKAEAKKTLLAEIAAKRQEKATAKLLAQKEREERRLAARKLKLESKLRARQLRDTGVSAE